MLPALKHGSKISRDNKSASWNDKLNVDVLRFIESRVNLFLSWFFFFFLLLRLFYFIFFWQFRLENGVYREWSKSFRWRNEFRGPLHADELKFSPGWNFILGWNLFRLQEHFNLHWKQDYFHAGWNQKHHLQYVYTSWYINENHC